MVQELKSYPQRKRAALAGKAICEILENLLGQHGNATWDEIGKLRLEYPDGSEKIQKRDLARVALRLEGVDYTRMLNDGALPRKPAPT